MLIDIRIEDNHQFVPIRIEIQLGLSFLFIGESNETIGCG